MNKNYDLDALIPEKRTIKYENEDIAIPPPKTGDLLKLGVLAEKMKDLANFDDAELNTSVLNLTQHVYKMIPGLNERPLNLAQLQLLIEILSDMGTPNDLKELDKRGIKPDTSTKKVGRS